MNVFDFDKTIFKADTSERFVIYCLLKKPLLMRFLPKMAFVGIRYKAGKMTKAQMKTALFSIFAHCQPIEPMIDRFWLKNKHKIARYYLNIHKDSDVVISASPYFLLEKICRELGVHTLIATHADPLTGAILGENCHGGEKVRRYREIFGDAPVDDFYSDSLSDTPMAEIAKRAFIVAGETTAPWPSVDKKK